MKVSVLFYFLRHGHRSHLWTHPHAQYVVLAVKIGILRWQSMENCSRPNSGTVSIEYKRGIGGITRHDTKVERTKVKVTRAHHSVNSSSHSVNGDIAVQWEWSNSTPHRIQTP